MTTPMPSPVGYGISPPDSPAPTGTPEVPTSTNTPPATLPQVTGISPASGAGAGGNSVTITGSGLGDATQVEFGGVSAVITGHSDTEVSVTSPPGSGTVDVTVVTPDGTSATSSLDRFSYQS